MATADGTQDSLLARVRADNGLPVNEKGLVDCPETPGLGVDVNLDTVRQYLQPVRIEVAGKLIHETPEVQGCDAEKSSLRHRYRI